MNAVVPAVRETLDIEMIRDGGSLAAKFSGMDGGEYILFVPIHLELVDSIAFKRVGYRPPQLIDCVRSHL